MLKKTSLKHHNGDGVQCGKAKTMLEVKEVS
jgi:hypothetical protein